MSNRDQEARDRQRAWALLAAVEDHPKIQKWLEEADARDPAADRRTAGLRAKAEMPAPKRLFWSAAAALVLAVGAASYVAYLYWGAQRYETRIGEQRDILLVDGSRMTLNTDTAVAVRYSRTARRIELLRGEVLFAVKHNQAQPFEVTAGETLTRALGTEFNVDLRTGKVTVSVLEGAVRVSALTHTETKAENPNAPGSDALVPVAVAKGEALEFRTLERGLREEKADLKRIDAWRARRLEFSNTPLQEAVEEFNRYSTTRITVGTAELEAVRVSGVFRTGDTAGFLYSLQEALRVEIHEAADKVILTRATPGP